MKKLYLFVLLLLALVCMLCACSVHRHDFSTVYAADDDNHWYACATCDEVKDKAPHTWIGEGVCSVCQHTPDPTPGVMYRISMDGVTAEVYAYEGTATTVKIAEEYEGRVVRSIYRAAFMNNTTVSSVIIPESIRKVGKNAFSGCTNLTSVFISDGVNSIDQWAFEGCTSLNAVHISDLTAWCNITFDHGPEANPLYFSNNLYLNGSLVTDLVIPDGITKLGNYAFSGCKSLTSVVISEGVKTVGMMAFAECSGLSSVVFPESLTGISYRAFYNCSSLTSIDLLHDCMKTLTNYVFEGCSGLTSVVIPDNITLMSDGVFRDCTGLTSVVIGSGISGIPMDTFSGCTSLSSVVIPGTVWNIGQWAFQNCTSLTSVVIENGVELIESLAFDGCSNLTSLILPDSVTKISDTAFDDCHSSLYTEYENGRYVRSGENPYAILIGLTDKNSETYRIHKMTKIIADSVFSNRLEMKSIILSDSLMSVGDEAFSSCPKLTDVYYTGDEEKWNTIHFGEGNFYLTSATRHYNYTPEE